MTASWHFNVDDKGVVHLQARFEGDDGAVGDAHDLVEPGGNFHNLTYEQLKRAGAGRIRVKADGSLFLVGFGTAVILVALIGLIWSLVPR